MQAVESKLVEAYVDSMNGNPLSAPQVCALNGIVAFEDIMGTPEMASMDDVAEVMRLSGARRNRSFAAVKSALTDICRFGADRGYMSRGSAERVARANYTETGASVYILSPDDLYSRFEKTRWSFESTDPGMYYPAMSALILAYHGMELEDMLKAGRWELPETDRTGQRILQVYASSNGFTGTDGRYIAYQDGDALFRGVRRPVMSAADIRVRVTKFNALTDGQLYLTLGSVQKSGRFRRMDLDGVQPEIRGELREFRHFKYLKSAQERF